MQLWRLACSKCAGQASWLETRGRVDVAVKSPQVQHPFYLGGISVSLLKPSTDWLRPTHIVESNLLSSKSIEININRIYKITFTASSRLPLEQISGYQSLDELTPKINHHVCAFQQFLKLKNIRGN